MVMVASACVCVHIYYICTHVVRMTTRPYTLPCTYVHTHVYVICTCKDGGGCGVVDECGGVVYAMQRCVRAHASNYQDIYVHNINVCFDYIVLNSSDERQLNDDEFGQMDENSGRSRRK